MSNREQQYELNRTISIRPNNSRPSVYGVESPKNPDLNGLEPWMDEANCKDEDPDLFFPERGGSTKKAKQLCGECAVRNVCLNFALDTPQKYGVWGQTSERERRKILREQKN